ncbi:hypothetical protein QMK54_08400 [Pseudomonas sp. P5_109]|uniref:hypothetical protein n=1 Tax=Pseudomonas sp. P5_109 TaxID=3043441 RepID=UPI002A35AD5F|nr:hypothetical protein [Pseudomonas sp. P5_109]WPN31763.1 hypothetical protein QMK54_08400 [Pseudomonas sp. P5_109]
MNLENIRYHIAVTLLVLGCSIPVMGMVVWVITEIIPLEGRALKIAYLTTYVFIVLLGLRFYIPRMRGMT